MNVLLAVLLVWMLLGVLGMGLMAWRVWHGNEELQAGGSMGRQLFGRAGDGRRARFRRRRR